MSATVFGALRLPARRAARGACPRSASRAYHAAIPRWAAQSFTMPSMSPTMTEGNIASWKIKEGDSFSAGDVLLEIETDKAQMDVEAQDDGILAKITLQNGSKGVKVGTRIAVLAEQGDDLATLEIPPDEQAASPQPERKESEAKKDSPSPKSPSTANSWSKSATSGYSSAPQKYPFYPAVQHLLHSHGLSSTDANSIPATGPNGRLLKGDVLAYLGQINQSYSSEQSARISKLGHLDLSNIKLATKAPSTEKAPSKSTEQTLESKADLPTNVALPISLTAVLATQRRIQEALGLKLPLSTFIARASEIANEDLPRAQGQVPSSEELFDAVLGLDKVNGRTKVRTSRGRYTPLVSALPPSHATSLPSRQSKGIDVIDEIAGTASSTSVKPHATALPRPGSAVSTSGSNIFSVAARKGEERRVRTYLERVKTVLESEPGRCVL